MEAICTYKGACGGAWHWCSHVMLPAEEQQTSFAASSRKHQWVIDRCGLGQAAPSYFSSLCSGQGCNGPALGPGHSKTESSSIGLSILTARF